MACTQLPFVFSRLGDRPLADQLVHSGRLPTDSRAPELDHGSCKNPVTSSKDCRKLRWLAPWGNSSIRIVAGRQASRASVTRYWKPPFKQPWTTHADDQRPVAGRPLAVLRPPDGLGLASRASRDRYRYTPVIPSQVGKLRVRGGFTGKQWWMFSPGDRPEQKVVWQSSHRFPGDVLSAER